MAPSGVDIVPLWESHGWITGAVVGPEVLFIKYHVEDVEEYEELGRSPHTVTADLLAWLWTERSVPDDQIRLLAEQLEFPRCDDFLSGLAEANSEGYEAQKAWESRFRRSL